MSAKRRLLVKIEMIDDDDKNLGKPEHPEKGANWLSRIMFWYTIPIFRQGAKRDFNEGDLTTPLDAHKSSFLGDTIAHFWNQEVLRAKDHNESPQLLTVLTRMFLKPTLLQGLTLFLMEIPVRLCQPLFLGMLLRYFSPENQNDLEP